VEDDSGKAVKAPLVKALSKKAVIPLILLGWGGLLAAGFGLLMLYEATAAIGGKLPAVVDSQFANWDHASLVLALHPHCPCSRATVQQLEKILSRAPVSAELTVLVFKPKDEPDSWIESSTVSSLKKFQTKLIVDGDGMKAQRLGLNASGQVQVYSASGALLYNGGITAGRGHGGDNIGAQTVLELLRGERVDAQSAPVFGCSIFDKPAAK
jgi:hypothetical protein